MADVAIVIPAAGAASRMRGRDKLLERIKNEPLLARQVRIALSAKAKVLVTLPPDNLARRALLHPVVSDQLSVVEIPDAAEGLAASIRAAGNWAESCGVDGLMILLADMPEIETDDLAQMIAAFGKNPDQALRAVTDDGTPGHPVIIPQRLFGALSKVKGDTGAKSILAQEIIAPHTLPGTRATTDLDRPEDWAAWRAKTGQ